jgi:hypothetical protein
VELRRTQRLTTSSYGPDPEGPPYQEP